MRLLKVKRNTKIMVEPLERKSLFKHCTGGFTCVEFKTFCNNTLPILHAHGISIVTYEENK